MDCQGRGYNGSPHCQGRQGYGPCLRLATPCDTALPCDTPPPGDTPRLAIPAAGEGRMESPQGDLVLLLLRLEPPVKQEPANPRVQKGFAGQPKNSCQGSARICIARIMIR